MCTASVLKTRFLTSPTRVIVPLTSAWLNDRGNKPLVSPNLVRAKLEVVRLVEGGVRVRRLSEELARRLSFSSTAESDSEVESVASVKPSSTTSSYLTSSLGSEPIQAQSPRVISRVAQESGFDLAEKADQLENRRGPVQAQVVQSPAPVLREPIMASDKAGKLAMESLLSYPSAAYEKLVDEFLKDISIGTCTLDLKDFATTYQYQGFDVEAIRVAFCTHHSKMNKAEVTIGDQIVRLDGLENFKNALFFTLAMFNLRGNNTTAITDGLDGTAKAQFKTYITAMLIKDKVVTTTQAKKRDTLTLARVSAAFPCHSILISTKDEFARAMFEVGDIGIDKNTVCGRAIMHSAAAATLTVDMKKQKVPYITFACALRLNDTIAGKNKQTNFALWRFHKNALNSRAVGEKEKEALWKQVGGCSDSVITSALAYLRSRGIENEIIDEVDQYCTSATIILP